jgi:hypothetical protein
MLKLNDTSGDRNEIGNSINSNQLEYASLKKYNKENNSVKLDRIKCILILI